MLRSKCFWVTTCALVGAAIGFQMMVRQATDYPDGKAAKLLRWAYRLNHPWDPCLPTGISHEPARMAARVGRPNRPNANQPAVVVEVARPAPPAEDVEVIEPITVEPPVGQANARRRQDGVEESEPRVVDIDPARFPPVVPARVSRMPYADEPVEQPATCTWFRPVCWLGLEEMVQEVVNHTIKVNDGGSGSEESEVIPPLHDHYHPPHCPYSGRCPAPSHYRPLEIPSNGPVMPPVRD